MIDLFNVLFYHTSIQYSGKDNFVSFIENEYAKQPTLKPDSWQEDVHTSIVYGKFSDNLDYFKQSSIPLDLVVEIDKVVQDFVQSKNLDSIGKFYIAEMWYNAYKNRQYQHMHKHSNGSNMFFSGVYYMRFDAKTHSATRFYNPHFEVDYENEFVKQHPLFVQIPDIKEDDVFIFPSDVGHDVLPQDSDQLRITVAFNVGCLFHEPQYAYS